MSQPFQIGESSVTSLVNYITGGENHVQIKDQQILVNGQQILSVKTRQPLDYQKKLTANQIFMIKQSGSGYLIDYGTIGSKQVIGKLIL